MGAPPLLIECGIPWSKLQAALDFKASELAGCLITHSHGDHAQSAINLIRAGIHCYATLETWTALKIGTGHFAHAVRSDIEFEVANWSVMPFKCVHDAEGTVGYSIVHGSRRVVFMTDSAFSRYRFEGVTHLCVECNHSVEIMRQRGFDGDLSPARYDRVRNNHMSLETLLTMLGEIDLSCLEEIHLLHLSDGNSDEAEFKKRIMAKTGVPVYVAGK